MGVGIWETSGGIAHVLFLDLSDGYMSEFGKSKNYEGVSLSHTNVSIMSAKVKR